MSGALKPAGASNALAASVVQQQFASFAAQLDARVCAAVGMCCVCVR